MAESDLSLRLDGSTVLITGAARRLGRVFALAVAHAGGDVVIHHGHSQEDAQSLREEIEVLGRSAIIIPADLANPAEAARLVEEASAWRPITALVNNAAIFEPLSLEQTRLSDWDRHLAINLTSPFTASQAFARLLPAACEGRIVNILDWRALRPGADHFPYTISKAALVSLTRAMAVALAPHIIVNGLALGAILPPSDGGDHPSIINAVPARRWARLDEVTQALLFLLAGPGYITGEILYVDGGRHLV